MALRHVGRETPGPRPRRAPDRHRDRDAGLPARDESCEPRAIPGEPGRLPCRGRGPSQRLEPAPRLRLGAAQYRPPGTAALWPAGVHPALVLRAGRDAPRGSGAARHRRATGARAPRPRADPADPSPDPQGLGAGVERVSELPRQRVGRYDVAGERPVRGKVHGHDGAPDTDSGVGGGRVSGETALRRSSLRGTLAFAPPSLAPLRLGAPGAKSGLRAGSPRRPRAAPQPRTLEVLGLLATTFLLDRGPGRRLVGQRDRDALVHRPRQALALLALPLRADGSESLRQRADSAAVVLGIRESELIHARTPRAVLRLHLGDDVVVELALR